MVDAIRRGPLPGAIHGMPLKVRLRRVERRRKLQALALVAPLFLFLSVSFAVPIAGLLYRSINSPEVLETLPRTAAEIRGWDGRGLPSEGVFAALAADMRTAKAAKTLALAARRLNYDIVGFRSLMLGTARKLLKTGAPPFRDAFISIDARWGDREYWAAIKRAAVPITGFYLLAALDRKVDAEGAISRVPREQALYVGIFLRTFWMSFVVMAACFALGYPLAYMLATLPTRIGNLLLILVLLPFWTSLLVRTTAWVVVLQKEGLVNDVLVGLAIVPEPMQLVFNRIGVYIAMVHILLPFMVLPIFSVMKGISPTHMRAAASLGAKPLFAFVKVYLPQTLPGIGAGCLLVFILAIGYYITPALIGGPKDQMISYFVAYFTNATLNWGMAAALGVVLLALTMILYAVYDRLIGVERLRLG